MTDKRSFRQFICHCVHHGYSGRGVVQETLDPLKVTSRAVVLLHCIYLAHTMGGENDLETHQLCHPAQILVYRLSRPVARVIAPISPDVIFTCLMCHTLVQLDRERYTASLARLAFGDRHLAIRIKLASLDGKNVSNTEASRKADLQRETIGRST